MRNFDHACFIQTKVGVLLIEVLHAKISKLIFNQPKNFQAGIKPKVVANFESQLLEYINGHRRDFSTPFHLVGTEFQKLVWQKILEIPYGKTISYGKLAAQLGDVKKIRAVANAVGKNPVPIIIPCHRVIGMHGHLTGYVGGLPLKKQLLEIESAKQLKLFN